MLSMLKKILFYFPKICLSWIYILRLKKGSLNQERFRSLLKTIRAHKLSPRRNGFPDLAKRVIAGYYIRPGDCVVDVGAHTGLYTAFYATLTGTKGRVHSYEAHPLIFKSLQKRFNHLSQVVVHHCAVSNSSNQKIAIQIYPNRIDQESATVEKALMNKERMPGDTTMVEIETQKLDHLEEPKVALIKIDVEGHEHAVISGATHLIQRQKPILIYEYGCIPGQFEPKTIEQVEKLGYVVYDCTTLKRVGSEFTPLEVTDLVAVPQEKIKELETLFSII